MKKYDIVYSVTAHESVDCLWDLYFNIRKFHAALDVLVIFHCSPSLRKEAMDMAPNNTTNPLFHPKPTVKARFTSSLFLAHLENYKYITQGGIEFDYFSTLASNCLFVRPIDFQDVVASARKLEYTMPNYTLGDEDRWQAEEFKKNPHLVGVFKKYGIEVRATLHEGAYFREDVIRFIHNFCCTNGINKEAFVHDTLAAEEIILPSIEAYACGGKFSKRFGVWIPGVTLDDVKSIATTGGTRSTIGNHFFIVKVPRDMNDEKRKYINSIEA